MSDRPRYILALTALCALPLLSGAAPAPLRGADVIVEISNLRSAKGTVRACMTDNRAVFPACSKDPASYRLVVPAGEARQLRFGNVRPGTYAIALLHDENDNGKADRALGMMPREGFGFSRDAKVRMGPPDFDDAAIEVSDERLREPIKMRYLL